LVASIKNASHHYQTATALSGSGCGRSGAGRGCGSAKRVLAKRRVKLLDVPTQLGFECGVVCQPLSAYGVLFNLLGHVNSSL